MHFVFTVCDNAAAEVCPVWPGQPMTAHWGIEDPAVAVGANDKARASRKAFRELDARIKIFTSLRIEMLDRMALKRQLDENRLDTGWKFHEDVASRLRALLQALRSP